MRPAYKAEAQAAANALHDILLRMVQAADAPGAVVWGAASALGDLVQQCVPPEHVQATLEGLAIAMGKAAQARALQDSPAQGRA